MSELVVPTNSNEFIEQQLNERLKALEEAFNADVLCLVAPMYSPVDDLVRVMIEERRGRDDSYERLAVLLTTDGGLIETTQRIAETFRHHYDDVIFIVPNYAFSTGTVLVMSGDHIHVDYYSRLGPIDPQVEREPGNWVPALGYLEQWNRYHQKFEDDKLTTLDFKLMVAMFDQAELYKYEQARDLSVLLLKQWLATFKFKDWNKTETTGETVTPEKRIQRAEEIGLLLNDTAEWHSHSHGISMKVLREKVNLKIVDMEDDAARHKKVRQYDGLLADYMQKMGNGGILHIVGRYRPLFLN